jgi:hypothetical protein
MNAVVCLDMIGKQTIITNPEDKKDKVSRWDEPHKWSTHGCESQH